MGDRCHVTLHIGGVLKTKEDMRTLLEAVEMERTGVVDDNQDFDETINELVDVHVAGEPWRVDLEEVNYANTEPLDAVLLELQLMWTKENDSGGGYSAHLEYSGFPVGSHTDFDLNAEAEPMLTLGDLQSVLVADPVNVVALLKAWVADATREVPALVLEGEALESVAPLIAKKAMGVKAA